MNNFARNNFEIFSMETTANWNELQRRIIQHKVCDVRMQQSILIKYFTTFSAQIIFSQEIKFAENRTENL